MIPRAPLLSALAALGLASASPAAGCDIALVLAVDVSGSVDAFEYQLQMQGIASALRDPAVVQALIQRRAALSVVQWSGSMEQTVTLPWVRIDEPAEVNRLPARIAAMPRAHAGGNTAVGEAIDIASELFGQVRDCAAWVIDVSGDGDENEGYTVGLARRAAWERGISINGLAIESPTTGRAITNFYRSWVVTPGGFVITADSFEDFERAMRQKLLRELIPPMALMPERRAAAMQLAALGPDSAQGALLRGFLRR